MAIERKDARPKLDDDMHGALRAICEVDNVDMGEFIERELVLVIRKRIHDATVLADRLDRLGITGKNRE